MKGAGRMELNPEEQSFFDEGDEIDDPSQVVAAPRRHRSGRHHRHHHHYHPHPWHRFRHNLRKLGWRRATRSAIMVIVTVMAGYWASMYVARQNMPSPSDYGVDVRKP